MKEDELFAAYRTQTPEADREHAGPTMPDLPWLPTTDLSGRQASLLEEKMRRRVGERFEDLGYIPCRQPHCMNLLVVGRGFLYCRDHRTSARTGPAR